MANLTLTEIRSENAGDLGELQRVLEAAPDYLTRISGEPASASAAQETVDALPPGKVLTDKVVFGIRKEGAMIGCIDVIRGFPTPATAMLGLLLFAEGHQRSGYGRRAYALLEDVIRTWPEIDTVRIGLVGSNDHVIPFWERMGFQDTGVRRPYECGPVRSVHFAYEKKLADARE